jgi:phenylacetate-CoA ligase
LYFPAGPAPKTAVILPSKLPWFAQTGGVRIFEPEDTAGLRKYEPEAIAAPAGYLVFLARMVDAGYFPSFHKPSHAMIAFTGMVSRAGSPSILTPIERDILWQVFQIPVFEQYLGMDGRLVAWECQAHEALHIVAENAVFERERMSELLFTSLTNCNTPTLRLTTKVSANVDSGRCSCGQPSPLLSGLRPVLSTVQARPASA